MQKVTESLAGRFGVINPGTLSARDVRNILALRTGRILSLSSIANDTGIAPNTVKSWISVLQASGHICLLKPYFNKKGKRIVKTPKMYFRDTGLALHLTGLTGGPILPHRFL